jgi:hypothetical protein
VTKEQANSLLQLVNEYRHIFALDMSELRCTNLIETTIAEIEGSKPVTCKPYKTTAKERETIRGIVQEWKAHGIFTETRSAYASPVLLVKKKTGEERLVVDYRKLNGQTVKKPLATSKH